MTRSWKWFVAAVALSFFGASCAFIEVEEGARNIEVIALARAENCERVGRTRVSVPDRVAFVTRSDRKIRRDLDKLARNSAADMGGDTVALASDVVEGRATYGVFRCIGG